MWPLGPFGDNYMLALSSSMAHVVKLCASRRGVEIMGGSHREICSFLELNRWQCDDEANTHVKVGSDEGPREKIVKLEKERFHPETEAKEKCQDLLLNKMLQQSPSPSDFSFASVDSFLLNHWPFGSNYDILFAHRHLFIVYWHLFKAFSLNCSHSQLLSETRVWRRCR